MDLFRECPFWYENGFCMNRDCGVETADEVSVACIREEFICKLIAFRVGSYSGKVADEGVEPSACDG